MRELKEKGYIEAGLDSEEDEQEDLGYPAPIPLEPLSQSAAAAVVAAAAVAEANLDSGISSRLGEILLPKTNRVVVEPVLAASAAPPATLPTPDSDTQTIGTTLPSQPRVAEAAIAKADTLYPEEAAKEETTELSKRDMPDKHTHKLQGEAEEQCEPLPPVQALQGMMKLGGRLKGQILSWEEDDNAQDSSHSIHTSHTLWSAQAGDVTVPGDVATVGEALAITASRAAGARVLLRGGRHSWGSGNESCE